MSDARDTAETTLGTQRFDLATETISGTLEDEQGDERPFLGVARAQRSTRGTKRRRSASRGCSEDPGAGIGEVISRMGEPASPLVQILWTALKRGEIDPPTAIREIEAGLPGGASALVPFTRHPLPAVRLAASGALARRHREPAPLEFTLLGGFSVTRGSWRADDDAWERRVAQRVVRLLLLHRDRALGEDEIFEVFWPDRPYDSARRSLHVAISRARRVLDSPGAPTVIEAADRHYRLRLRPGDHIDADEFEAAAQQALTEQAAATVRPLERAAAGA